MDRSPKKVSNIDVELLSEEVQEVMNRIPSIIVRWGMSIMSIILAGILVAAAYIKWPKTIESPFEGQQIGNNIVVLKTALSSETLCCLLHADKQSICVYSPGFQQKYSSYGITGEITHITVLSRSNDQYNAALKVVLDNYEITTNSIFYGNVQFTLSEKTLLQYIIGSIKRR